MMAIIFNSDIIISREWPAFEAVLNGTEKSLPIQFEKTSAKYEIFAVDRYMTYKTQIYLDGQEPVGWTAQQISDNATWRTDFENNWQSGANIQIDDTRADTSYRRRLIVDADGDVLGSETNPFVTSAIATGTSATGATRVASLQQIFASTQPFEKDVLLFNESLTGGATSVFNSNEALVDMTVGTAPGDKVVRQSRYYIPHPSGASIIAFIDAVMGAAKTNVRQQVGIFDDDNGYFIEQTASGISAVRRTKVTGSVVDNTVAQALWNLDVLDGNGPSGITLDLSKIQTFVVDLTSGSCRLGVILDGSIVNFHEFLVDNVISLPGIAARSLPIRLAIENTGTAASPTTLKQMSATAYGDYDIREFGIIGSANTNFGTRIMPAGSDSPLVSVRLKATHVRGLIYPVFFDLLTTQSRNLRIRIVLGGTVTGGSWSSVSSAAEANATATSQSGGTTIWTSYMSAGIPGKSEQIEPSILVSSNISGTPEPMTLMVGSILSTAACAGSLNWREIA